MTEQQWNFAGIEAAASAIQGNVTSIHSLLDEGARIGKPTEAQRPDSAPDVRRPVGAVRVGPAAATPTPTSASANSDADRRRRAALAGTGRI